MDDKIQNLVKEIGDQMEYLFFTSLIANSGGEDVVRFLGILVDEGCPINVVNSALKKYAKTTKTGDDEK